MRIQPTHTGSGRGAKYSISLARRTRVREYTVTFVYSNTRTNNILIRVIQFTQQRTQCVVQANGVQISPYTNLTINDIAKRTGY